MSYHGSDLLPIKMGSHWLMLGASCMYSSMKLGDNKLVHSLLEEKNFFKH
jgi:hypothetical protein